MTDLDATPGLASRRHSLDDPAFRTDFQPPGGKLIERFAVSSRHFGPLHSTDAIKEDIQGAAGSHSRIELPPTAVGMSPIRTSG